MLSVSATYGVWMISAHICEKLPSGIPKVNHDKKQSGLFSLKAWSNLFSNHIAKVEIEERSTEDKKDKKMWKNVYTTKITMVRSDYLWIILSYYSGNILPVIRGN